jgi:hypothetical protein
VVNRKEAARVGAPQGLVVTSVDQSEARNARRRIALGVSGRCAQGRMLDQSTNRLLGEKPAVVCWCSHHCTLIPLNNPAL